MDNLSDGFEEVVKYCKDKNINIFKGIVNYPTLPPQFVVYWDRKADNNYKDFIEVADRLGVKLVYIARSYVNKEMASRLGGHEGEVGFLTIGFFVNGIIHVFFIDASWYKPAPLQPKPASTSYA
jgi:hypothetical protein